MSSVLGMRALRIQPAALAARHATSSSGTHRLITNTPTCQTASLSQHRQLSKPHTSRRFASNQPGAAAQTKGPSSTEINIAPAQESTATIPSPESLLNPPATTRPPPLDVPARDPEKSLPGYLFTVGKTYIKFYKSGLRNILTNRKLLAASSAAAPPKLDHGRSGSQALTFPSRADALLRERTLHDLARLPVFGLIILVCGEFTPLIVVAFPRLTPYTCRIPKQIERLRATSEKRRAASFQNLRFTAPARQLAGTAPPSRSAENSSNASNSNSITSIAKLAPGHIARTLGLTSQLWDRIGMDSPFSAAAARRAVSRIATDDRLIRRDGGVTGLVDDEVVLACEARGLNVRGHETRDLRRRLDEWVRTTTRGGGGVSGAQQDGERDIAANEAVRKLLLSEEVVTGGKSSTEGKKGSDK